MDTKNVTPGRPPDAIPPPTGSAPPQRLYRSRQDRMVGGVCGGLGQYFNVDPVLIRLAFVLLMLGGAGVLAYIILWIIVPEYPLGEPERPITSSLGAGHGRELLAWGLLILGVLFLAGNLNLVPWSLWGQFWPLLIVAVGIALLLQRSATE